MALLQLRITNLAVVEHAVLEFRDGFSVMTGETGSGKSVCVGALRLALGGRVEGDPLRVGADRAMVAAVVDDIPAGVVERLRELGLPDDQPLTLQRELVRGGRGTCRVNGAVVSTATLRELGEALVELTGQGESHHLLRPARQRALLDASGGVPLLRLREEVAALAGRWRDLERQVREASDRAAAAAAEVEEAEALQATLEPLALQAGEDVALALERDRLRHGARLQAAAHGIAAACSGGDELGAGDLLAIAAERGRSAAGIDPAVDALLAGCVDALERLRDLGAEARRCADALVVDEARLSEVEERLDVLERVRRRHGSVEDAIAALARAELLVAAARGGAGSVAGLRARATAARDELGVAAGHLSRARLVAATRLQRAVEGRLRRLQLPHARFRVVLARRADEAGVPCDGELVACGPAGLDEVEFRLAANREGLPLPLDFGISGGELSRLALALRAVVPVGDDTPTLILDEIDTGVGGETAARVGEVLQDIGRGRQVVAITHRAEIAARAAGHLVVSKAERAGVAVSTVRAVAGEEQVLEVARLLSGRDTAAARARARELLAEGHEVEEAAPSTMSPR